MQMAFKLDGKHDIRGLQFRLQWIQRPVPPVDCAIHDQSWAGHRDSESHWWPARRGAVPHQWSPVHGSARQKARLEVRQRRQNNYSSCNLAVSEHLRSLIIFDSSYVTLGVTRCYRKYESSTLTLTLNLTLALTLPCQSVSCQLSAVSLSGAPCGDTSVSCQSARGGGARRRSVCQLSPAAARQSAACAVTVRNCLRTRAAPVIVFWKLLDASRSDRCDVYTTSPSLLSRAPHCNASCAWTER